MTLSLLLLAVIIAVIAIPAAQRINDMAETPKLAWLLVLASVAIPVWVALSVLQPGPALSSAAVAKNRDMVQLEFPPGHSLMVTAMLSDDEEAPKTSYALRVQGDGYAQNYTGTVKKKDSGGGPDVDLVDGQGVTDSERSRSGRVGEDLQERYDVPASGLMDVSVINWQGQAAAALRLEVVKGPPSIWLLWGLAGLISLIGLYLDVWEGCDKLAGDMAALAVYGALMPQAGITPLDSLTGLAFAGLGALLVGQFAVGALAWLAQKYRGSMVATIEEPEDEQPRPPPRKRRR